MTTPTDPILTTPSPSKVLARKYGLYVLLLIATVAAIAPWGYLLSYIKSNDARITLLEKHVAELKP